MVENIPLARALAKEGEIGRAVLTKWYQAVGWSVREVYTQGNNGKRRRGGHRQ
jgi:flagellar biosynthesis protein FlhB